jgi:phosphate starvation-inducible protein PhoH and related proteins
MSRKNSNSNVVYLKPAHIQPKNRKQDDFLKAMRTSTLSVAYGSAGVGKTFLAASMAANLLVGGRIARIILTRPNLPTGRTLGSVPGDVSEKMAMWLAPLITVLRQQLTPHHFEYYKNKSQILYQPLESIRGASFDDSFIIVDEAQNLTVEEIKALSTRIGENSRLVFLGDPFQRDVKESGLEWFINLCHKYELSCPVIEFTSDDIVRSDIVKELVKAFEREQKYPR